MDFGPGTYGLAFAAGGLSTLSPCVLPLVPILAGAAAASHRLGPLALAAGLSLSFTVVGLFVASLGAALGIGQGPFRDIAALILIAFGILLLSSRLQASFAALLSGLSSAGNGLLSRLRLEGLGGQFLLGLLLGIAWSPCVGPTLGAAITLASRGESLPQAALAMALFGLGAGLPLLLLGLASREAMLRLRGGLAAAGLLGKRLLGGLLLILGAAILSGADKLFEAWVLRSAPPWLVSLTTSL
ncbi:MAG: cytochrome C biogenesis protein [Gammaproteobacteria bacterium RIFOXYD12_FULL_61_37]|nr:MAG: cytochrome C biogenesis protein [Gammaproteobacteria bacterium RIFOXYD12_FULL_61_37]